MKTFSEFIKESQYADLHAGKIQKKLIKKLTDEDKNFVKFLFHDEKRNVGRTMEEVEKALWKVDSKLIDEYFEHVTAILKYVDFTPEQVVSTYSLARSGKQMKIEVIAQVGYFAYEAIVFG